MELIDFSQFAARRAARAQQARDDIAMDGTSVGDRWAELHAKTDDTESEFWDDLQFRLAYPTHRLRKH